MATAMTLESLFAEVRAEGWTVSLYELANDEWVITLTKKGHACECLASHTGQGLAINLAYAIRKMRLVSREFETEKKKAEGFMAKFAQIEQPKIRRRI